MYLDRRVSQPKRSIPGVIVTILPSSDLDILDNLEIDNNAEVMGRSWGDVHEMLFDMGWEIEMAIPTRVHSSLVRIVIRTRGKLMKISEAFIGQTSREHCLGLLG